ALVDESLNLAYHGARAEKQGFQINIERSFDSAAGEVDVFPQEITRSPEPDLERLLCGLATIQSPPQPWPRGNGCSARNISLALRKSTTPARHNDPTASVSFIRRRVKKLGGRYSMR